MSWRNRWKNQDNEKVVCVKNGVVKKKTDKNVYFYDVRVIVRVCE